MEKEACMYVQAAVQVNRLKKELVEDEEDDEGSSANTTAVNLEPTCHKR